MPRSRRLVRWAGRVPLALGLLAWTPGAGAWGPQTRMSMADEAVRLMPASLRIALQTHRQSLMRGMLTPLTEENAPGQWRVCRARWIHRRREIGSRGR